MALTTPARLSLCCSGELPAPGSRWRDHSSSESYKGSSWAERLPAHRVELSTLGQHSSHELPLLQIHIPPTSARTDPCPASARTLHRGSPTMPVTDKLHNLGPNPHLDQPACRQASTLVPFQDHRYDAGISHQPEHPAPSKAGGDKVTPPPATLCMAVCRGVTAEPPNHIQVAVTSPLVTIPAPALLPNVEGHRGVLRDHGSPSKSNPLPQGHDTAVRGSHCQASLKADTHR